MIYISVLHKVMRSMPLFLKSRTIKSTPRPKHIIILNWLPNNYQDNFVINHACNKTLRLLYPWFIVKHLRFCICCFYNCFMLSPFMKIRYFCRQIFKGFCWNFFKTIFDDTELYMQHGYPFITTNMFYRLDV